MKKTSAQKSKEWRKNNPEKVKAYYERTKDRRKRYYEENKEKIMKNQKQWFKENEEERKEHAKEYRQKNKKRISNVAKIKNKRYMENHPEKFKEWQDNHHFGGMRIKTLERDNFTCQKCGMTEKQHLKKWGCSLNVHHQDGNGRGKQKKNNNLSNLQTLCKSCHKKEHMKNMRSQEVPKSEGKDE